MINEYIGVDIGKTKVIVCVVDADGVIRHRQQEQTDITNGGFYIIEQVYELIDATILKYGKKNIRGIGIGSSGVVDPDKGMIVSSGSIPNWRNINICDLLTEKYRINTVIDNDVYVAALGEHTFGAARGLRDSVLFSISTGVGVAIIQQNNILHGTNNISGQIAHLKIFDGKTPNDVFSGRGIAVQASEVFGKNLSTKEVFEKAYDGDQKAVKVISNAAKEAAKIIALLQSTIDPQAFIFAGSVVINNKLFFDEIKKYSNDYFNEYLDKLSDGIEFKMAQLGIDSVAIGASSLCINKITGK